MQYQDHLILGIGSTDAVKHIVVDMPADRLHIVDNRTIPDICLQHLVAMMIVDGGVTFKQRAQCRPHARPHSAGDPQAGGGGAEWNW